MTSTECLKYKLVFALVLHYYDERLTEKTRAIKSEVKPGVTPGSHTFSRASSRLPAFAFALDFNLLTGIPLSFVISQRDDFGFAFTEMLGAKLFQSIFFARAFLNSNTSVKGISN